MIVLAVTWKAHPGKEDEVVRAFSNLQTESRKEPGCVLYIVHRGHEDRSLFLVYEQYKDEAALEAHRATVHFKQYARGELLKLGERVEANLYEPI
ncbi:MAG: antibiotic biosynthesis monooxygenase [Acidobacteriia bacterium]|nr:antibiotic biosynthesis monooxygenase [Terriglobia bacterium]